MLLTIPQELTRDVLTRVHLFSARSIYCVSKNLRLIMPMRKHFMLSSKPKFTLLTTTVLIMDDQCELYVTTASESRHMPRWPATIQPCSPYMRLATKICCFYQDGFYQDCFLKKIKWQLMSGVRIVLTDDSLTMQKGKPPFEDPDDKFFTDIFTEMPESRAVYSCKFVCGGMLDHCIGKISAGYGRFVYRLHSRYDKDAADE
jgi:hypothetical protein